MKVLLVPIEPESRNPEGMTRLEEIARRHEEFDRIIVMGDFITFSKATIFLDKRGIPEGKLAGANESLYVFQDSHALSVMFVSHGVNPRKDEISIMAEEDQLEVCEEVMMKLWGVTIHKIVVPNYQSKSGAGSVLVRLLKSLLRLSS